MSSRYSKVAIGGTFNVLHIGHHSLIDRAFQIGNEVVIGITSDEMASRWRPGLEVRPYAERLRDVEEYLKSRGWHSRAIITKLTDRFGSATQEEDIEAIVVSPETLITAEDINTERGNKGMRKLDIYVIPFVIAEDGERVQARKILMGRLNPYGKLDRKLVVYVGTTNRSKLSGITQTLTRFFIETKRAEKGAYIIYGPVDAGMPNLPQEGEILIGAVRRANRAFSSEFQENPSVLDLSPNGTVSSVELKELPRADFGIGIEAGIVRKDGKLFGIQYAAVRDNDGIVNTGHSSGFALTKGLIRALKSNGYDLKDAMWELYHVKGIGDTLGAVGILSDGLITREDISFQSVSTAFIYWSRNFRMTEI